MARDLRVASRSAFFRMPAVRLRILYRPDAVADLSWRVPPEVLSRLLLFGDVISAEEALAELRRGGTEQFQPLRRRLAAPHDRVAALAAAKAGTRKPW
jgi:enoyl-CoA hydratase/carnithine racemase